MNKFGRGKIPGYGPFTKKYSERYGVSQREARKIIGNVLELMTEFMTEDIGIQFLGYFTIKKKLIKERKLKNFDRLDEEIIVSEHYELRFLQGNKVKKKLKEQPIPKEIQTG